MPIIRNMETGRFVKGYHPKTEFKKGHNPWDKNKSRSKGTKEKISLANKGHKVSDRTRKKLSEAAKGNQNSLGYRFSEESKRKMSNAHLGKHLSEETKEKLSKTWNGRNNPRYGKSLSLKEKRKISETLKRKWKDTKFVRRMLKLRRIKPNKKEIKLNSILQEILPNEYGLNVKANIMTLGGKIPDFININGQKKLIELFGDYFHNLDYFPNKETPAERESFFRQFGWTSLIIWEKELENILLLKQKILQFNKEQKCQV